MDKTLHNSLSALEAKLSVLLGSITSSPTAAGAPAATYALLDADDALSSGLQTLRTHQTNYARILRLRGEARGLEERIRGIVREIGGIGDEISAARNEGYAGSDSDESDDDSESDSENENEDVRMTTDDGYQPPRKGPKEVDYKLLLDFARRISTYNVQAAADAAAGVGKEASRVTETEEKTVEHKEGEEEEKAQKDPGLAAVTQEATSWLNETANLTRDASLVPYPTEDRIRMGLMGQLQAAAAEKGGDTEREVEQMLQTAESSGTDTAPAVGDAGGEPSASGAPAEPGHARPMAGAAGVSDVGAVGTTGGQGQGQVQGEKPKPKFDLDLYDPEDDDV